MVEEAILELARAVAETELGMSFASLWDENPGVRKLNLYACPGYRTSPEEEQQKAFVLAHREFFYADEDARIPKPTYVGLLWDKIDLFEKKWREERHENFWVAAEAMEAVLKKAKIKPPKYGQSK